MKTAVVAELILHTPLLHTSDCFLVALIVAIVVVLIILIIILSD